MKTSQNSLFNYLQNSKSSKILISLKDFFSFIIFLFSKMVELVEVKDGSPDIINDSDGDYEDIEESQKLIENVDSDDEDFIEDESIIERIAALVDIVPPTTRQRIYNCAGSTLNTGIRIGKTIGSGLWVLATGALLVLLPVSLELERDAMAVQQDYQMRSGSQ
jgi:import receptor subunit TOM22